METVTLTSQQLLLLLELCLDAEDRCDQRIAAARSAGDYASAAYEVQLKEQYESMKQRVFQHMKGGIPSHPDEQELIAYASTLRNSSRLTSASE